MQNKFRGVMQSPVTPLKDDFSLDLPTFERLLDFHVRTGAPAISWPHHKARVAQSHDRRAQAVRRSRRQGRRPAACRSPSTSARSRSRTRWRWRGTRRRSAPTASSPSRPISGRRRCEAIDDYFVRLCTSIDLPVLSYNSPSYLAGVEITGELMARLIERLPNFVGVKEASFNSEKFLEISRAALALRPNFAHAHRRRVPAAVGAARRRRLVFRRRLDLPESVHANCSTPASPANGRARASCNTR